MIRRLLNAIWRLWKPRVEAGPVLTAWGPNGFRVSSWHPASGAVFPTKLYVETYREAPKIQVDEWVKLWIDGVLYMRVITELKEMTHRMDTSLIGEEAWLLTLGLIPDESESRKPYWELRFIGTDEPGITIHNWTYGYADGPKSRWCDDKVCLRHDISMPLVDRFRMDIRSQEHARPELAKVILETIKAVESEPSIAQQWDTTNVIEGLTGLIGKRVRDGS